MKKILAATILTLSTTLPSIAEEAKQALIVDAPATWKVEFKGDTALLMFSRWPAPGNVNQIPETVEMLAKGFVAQAKDNKDLKLKTTDYKIEEIDGDTFSGRFVQFEIEGGFCQTMFMIGDTEGIWNGQFTGTKERWTEALSSLKKLKKKEG